MAAIAVSGLSKTYPVAVKEPGWKGTIAHFFQRRYRLVQAVKEVSFRVEPGEIVGFLGPNGAGKTTTLKMLTGLIHPSAGEVNVVGYEPFQRQPEFLQAITLVMGQKQQLLWDLPALDSLKINAAVYGLTDKEARSRIGELSEMLAVEKQLTQPVRKLSLGERMKAELLAALLHRPKVLFLDEPTLGLDINAQMAVREFLRDYNERYRATVILTSHYMADITALAERVLLIYQGGLIYDGNLDGLLVRFAPYREIKLELARDGRERDLSERELSERVLSSYGEVRSLDGCSVRLLVQREQLTQVVARLLADFDVVDLTVTDPPVEEAIGRVFQTGAVA